MCAVPVHDCAEIWRTNTPGAGTVFEVCVWGNGYIQPLPHFVFFKHNLWSNFGDFFFGGFEFSLTFPSALRQDQKAHMSFHRVVGLCGGRGGDYNGRGARIVFAIALMPPRLRAAGPS